ncbi:MAG: hypothetical protein AAF799_40820 [Myxococcota bacterium]
MLAPLSARLAAALLVTSPAAAATATEAEPAASEAPPATAEPASDESDDVESEAPRSASRTEIKDRRFMVGLEGVVLQAPPLRPDAVRFDSRFIGRSVSMGGLGLLARYRVHPRIALETSVRSGSARYDGRDEGDEEAGSSNVVSHDQVMADVGVLLFVARGETAHLAFDAGLGGMGSSVDYELDRGGTQTFGSGLVRIGADLEFLVKRIAFVVSIRAVGVFTDLDRVRNEGPAFEGRDLPAPVPALQTMLVGAAGVAYRF